MFYYELIGRTLWIKKENEKEYGITILGEVFEVICDLQDKIYKLEKEIELNS